MEVCRLLVGVGITEWAPATLSELIRRLFGWFGPKVATGVATVGLGERNRLRGSGRVWSRFATRFWF